MRMVRHRGPGYFSSWENTEAAMELRGRLCAALCMCLVVIIGQVTGDRTSRKIYVEINGIRACFRRMNATHQIGCSSAQGGNVGVVHHIKDADDMKWLLDKGPHTPYAVVITSQMFNRDNVLKLRESQKVNAILVIHSNHSDAPDRFSADSTCPNNGYGLYKESEDYGNCRQGDWNPAASGLMFEDFDFPIVALTNYSEVNHLVNHCYEKFNKPDVNGSARQYPLCAALVKDAMMAAKDTPTCIRRSNLKLNLNPEKYCDPLGDQNIFGFLRPVTEDKPYENDSIIIAATRMDGFSLFDKISPNAEGTASGLITLLAAAHALGQVKATLGDDYKPILFTFFAGEAYDYIGSSRMVYDMDKGYFPTKVPIGPQPVKLRHLKAIFEVSQVALPESGKMWVHSDPLSPSEVKDQVADIAETIKELGKAEDIDLKVDRTSTSTPLPSASSQSFLKKMDLPVILMADHNKAYNNKYYNSRFDVPATIHADYPPGMNASDEYDYITPAAAHLQKVATIVARTLFTMATDNKSASHISVDNTTVANLLYCFLHSPRCELFKQIVPEESHKRLSETPYPFYVGVSIDKATPQGVAYMTRNLLAYFLGDRLNITEENCTQISKKNLEFKYMYLPGPVNATGNRSGICIQTTANYTIARSPAFDIDGYDWSSNQYSSWTESQWMLDAMQVRIFLVPSKTREIAILCGGLGFAAVTTIVIYFVNSRARSMFTFTE